MTDPSLARDGRARHWILDATLGGAAALCAITLAHASLPDASRPVETVVLASAPAPREPPVLIAFEDPVPGREIVSPFGLRRLPWEEGGRLHAGVDISAGSGEPVRAAADGVVVAAGQSPTYGRYVAIRHAEGLTSFYAHMGRVEPHVRSGVALKAGAAVGRIGSSGTSTGPHLHFEIRDRGDRPLNPSLFLGRRFAEAGDLPLRTAQRFGRTVRIAHVSRIPSGKRALMQAGRDAEGTPPAGETGVKVLVFDAAGEAEPAAAERIDGLKILRIGEDGRPRAQIGP